MASRSHLARLAAVTFAAGIALAFSAAPAVAETRGELTGENIRGENFHFDSRVPNVGDHSDTELFGLKAGEDLLRAYCVEVSQSIKDRARYVEVPWDRYPGRFSRPGKVLWVLNHGFPKVNPEELGRRAGVEDLTAKEALTATQGAVWHFSNDVRSNDERNSDEIRAVYRYLIEQARDEAQPRPSLDIVGEPRGHAGELVGPFTVHSSARGPVDVEVRGDADVALVTKDGKPVGKARDGDKLYVSVPAEAAKGQAEIRVRGRSVVEAGRLFIDRENQDERRRSQSLIVASPTEVLVEDQIRVEWEGPRSTTPRPAPPKAEELAATGADVKIAIGLGVLLIGGGGAALFLLRRRGRNAEG